MFGRDRNQALVSELVKLRHVLFCIAAIDFVDEQQRSRCSRPQLGGDIAILGHHSGRAIDDEQDQIGLLDRPAGLGANLRRVGGHRRIAVFEPAGVGQVVPTAVIKLRDRRQPVASHPRHVVDERAPRPDQAIEQCRLAYVRAADDHHAFHARNATMYIPWLTALSHPAGCAAPSFRFAKCIGIFAPSATSTHST